MILGRYVKYATNTSRCQDLHEFRRLTGSVNLVRAQAMAMTAVTGPYPRVSPACHALEVKSAVEKIICGRLNSKFV